MSDIDSVVVDSREPDEMDVIFEDDDSVVNVMRKQIPVGDYLVRADMEEKPIVFERKTVSDYVGSIKSRRLETQIKAMVDEFGPERSFLLVEGDMDEFDYLPYSDFSSKSVRGFTASISARWQTVPLFCSDKIKLGDMVVRISRKMIEEPTHVVREPDNTPAEANADYMDRALLQLDGVGDDLKEKLRDRYDTLSAIATASPQELKEIDGIGSKKAEQINKQFKGDQ